jgi:hypothetical protein
MKEPTSVKRCWLFCFLGVKKGGDNKSDNTFVLTHNETGADFMRAGNVPGAHKVKPSDACTALHKTAGEVKSYDLKPEPDP